MEAISEANKYKKELKVPAKSRNYGADVVKVVVLIFLVYIILRMFGLQVSVNSPKAVTSNTASSTVQIISDEEKASLAKTYCQERKNATRRYPLPVKNSATSDTLYELKTDPNKAGQSLTQTDCLDILNYLIWFKEYTSSKATVSIEDIVNRKYWIGMSVIELLTSLGIPDDINTTNYGTGETGQWIYYKDSQKIRSLMIYVEQGKVTSYQDF